MNLDKRLYVVVPARGDVYHVIRHTHANALCGQWFGNEYRLQRWLSRLDAPPPNCIPCVARLP